MLKTGRDAICELKTKFIALELVLHVSKTVTYNLTKNVETFELKCYENK